MAWQVHWATAQVMVAVATGGEAPRVLAAFLVAPPHTLPVCLYMHSLAHTYVHDTHTLTLMKAA